MEKFAPKGKKGVDFLILLEREQLLILTELKNFERIDKKGRYKKGTYSFELCKDVAQKFCDTLEGLNSPSDLVECEERSFAMKVFKLKNKAVFHWELKKTLRCDIRKQQYVLMAKGLKAQMHALKNPSVHVLVFNIHDYPAPCSWWTVKRIQK